MREEGDDIVAVVAVGREGVVWRGRGAMEEGLLSVLPSVFLLVWNPYRKGGTNFPSGPSSLAFSPALRFAHTCDLRCVMRRRLMCVHPFSLLPSSRVLKPGETVAICTAYTGGEEV